MMKLLQRWNGKGGGPRPHPPVESQPWPVGKTIAAPEKRLRRLRLPSPCQGGEGNRTERGGEESPFLANSQS